MTEAGSSAAVAGSAAPITADGAVAVAFAPAIEAAFAAAKLTLQPVASATQATEPDRFLGWSTDGASYLARVTFERLEEPGIEPVGFNLVEVRDTISQQVIATYQDTMWPARKQAERVLAEASPEDQKRVPLAVWDAAKPARELATARPGFVELGKIVPADPGPHARRESPAGASITAVLRGKPPFKSKFTITPEKYGFGFDWTGFAADPDPDRKAPRPAIDVAVKTTAGTYPLVTATMTIDYEAFHSTIDENEPSLTGEIRVYWSPVGTHLALNVLELPEGGHEEMGWGLMTRAFVRSVGPQIKVVAAGASYELARKAAAVFTHAGHPVTQVEHGTTAIAGGVIYYRGDAGKQTAEALAKLVPGLKLEALAKPGWLDVIVTLGT